MSFLTVEQTFNAEYEEKQSRFIAHLIPYTDFDETLESLRSRHPKASHHVTAFRFISDQNQISERAKDDGEPAGTSGMPVLKTLIGANLIDIAVIVTRYFGGTKLGTGGLARAYAGASNLVIEQADLVPWKRIIQYEVSSDFSRSSEIERQVKIAQLCVLDRRFNEEGVVFRLEGAEDDIVAFKIAIS